MRLIDADELVDRVVQIRNTDVGNGTLAGWCLDTILRFVDEATTVDAVEVVRCKDCKHYRHDDVFHRWYCSIGMTKRATSKDDYCSMGERREDAD